MDIKIVFAVMAVLAAFCYTQNAECAPNKTEAREKRELITAATIAAGAAVAGVAIPLIRDAIDWATGKAKEVREAKLREQWSCGNRTIMYLPKSSQEKINNEIEAMAQGRIDPLWLLRRQLFQSSTHEYFLKFKEADLVLKQLLTDSRNILRSDLDNNIKLESMQVLSDFIRGRVDTLKELFVRDEPYKIITGLLTNTMELSPEARKCAAQLIFIDNGNGKNDCVRKIKDKFRSIVEQTDRLQTEGVFGYEDARKNPARAGDYFKSLLDEVESTTVFDEAAKFIDSFEDDDPGFLSFLVAGVLDEKENCKKILEDRLNALNNEN